METLKGNDTGFKYLITYCISIFIVLLLASHIVGWAAGSYPILGSPILLYVMALFVASQLHINAKYLELPKQDKINIVLILPLIMTVMMFVRSRLLLQAEVTTQAHIIHFLTAWFSVTVVTSVMLFGVYKVLYIRANSNKEEK